MNGLYSNVVELFYHLANAFFWPIAVALLSGLAFSSFDLGRVLCVAWRRRKVRPVDLAEMAEAICLGLRRGDAPTAAMSGIESSRALLRFWARVRQHLNDVGDRRDFDIWLAEALRQEELAAARVLDVSRMLVRIGPMLGLCGTIIPLGPALRSLLNGDIADMVNHLVIGFGAVVCGLVMSGVCYFITLVRERWVRAELKQMEDFSDLLVRAVERGEENYADAALQQA